MTIFVIALSNGDKFNLIKNSDVNTFRKNVKLKPFSTMDLYDSIFKINFHSNHYF